MWSHKYKAVTFDADLLLLFTKKHPPQKTKKQNLKLSWWVRTEGRVVWTWSSLNYVSVWVSLWSSLNFVSEQVCLGVKFMNKGQMVSVVYVAYVDERNVSCIKQTHALLQSQYERAFSAPLFLHWTLMGLTKFIYVQVCKNILLFTIRYHFSFSS